MISGELVVNLQVPTLTAGKRFYSLSPIQRRASLGHDSGIGRLIPRLPRQEVLNYRIDQAGRNDIAWKGIADEFPGIVLPRRERIVDRQALTTEREVSVIHGVGWHSCNRRPGLPFLKVASISEQE